jgi:hypothetical protein
MTYAKLHRENLSDSHPPPIDGLSGPSSSQPDPLPVSQFVISLLLDVELRWEDSNQRHSTGELKNLVSHCWCFSHCWCLVGLHFFFLWSHFLDSNTVRACWCSGATGAPDSRGLKLVLRRQWIWSRCSGAAGAREQSCGHWCKRSEAQWKERTSVSDQRSRRFRVNCNNAHVHNI